MTEAEWDRCTDVIRMLEWLGGVATSRKRRLFGCACCRRVWDLLTSEHSRRAVEVAERFADGLAGEQERRAGRNGRPSMPPASDAPGLPVPVPCSGRRRRPRGLRHKQGAIHAVRDAAAARAEGPGRYEAGILRDLFGNPCRPPPAVEPACLALNGGAVRKLAQAIYDGGRFGDLPVLADALEEAGCDSPELLRHCRGGGEHVRGCWLLDLLLGKR